MAKDKTNGMATWIRLLIAVGTVLVSITAAFVLAKADIRAVDTKAGGIETSVSTLKTEGCDPSDKNKMDIAVMQTNQKNMHKTIEEVRTEQKAMRKETREAFIQVLERLPEK